MAVLRWGVGRYDVDVWGPAVVDTPPIVVGDGFTISVGLWIADIDNALIADISEFLVDGSIDMNLDRAIKLAATFTIREPSIVTPYTDFLAPYFRKTYQDGRPDDYQQVGLFATQVAPGSYTITDSVATFQGSDLTSVLAQSFYTDVSNISAATGYRDQLLATLAGAGVNRSNIPTTDELFPVAQSFPIGTARLDKANTLLDQLGWYHMGADLDGRVSTPGAPQNLSSKEPWRVLTDEDLMGPIEVQPAGQGIANVVLVINDDAAAAPLHAVARNDDPSSPTSTVAIGRDIMRLEKVTGSTTQAALDATAARLLTESRTFYEVVKVTILHDPTALVMHQTVRLDLTGEQASKSGLYWVRTSSLGLTPDKPTVLELNRVTDSLGDSTI